MEKPDTQPDTDKNPRHPLALLDLLIRVNAAAQNPGEEHEDLAEQFTQVMADPATGEQLRALRAQAEAGVRGRTYTWTEINRAQWAIHMAHWHGERGGASQEVLSALLWAHQCVVNVMDGKDPTDALPAVVALVDAALAQAGGDGQ